MLVAHGLWSSRSALWIWAEDSSGARHRSPPAHPFAASHRRLASLVSGGRRRVEKLALPTRGGAPMPSPLLPVEAPRAPGAPALRPWQVPVVELAPLDAVRWLLGSSHADASLRWLTGAADLAVWLASRGRVLPRVVDEQARWTPMPTAGDASRLHDLARSMPPSCLAEAGPRGLSGPSPSEILGDLVSTVVDAVARDAVSLPGELGRALSTRNASFRDFGRTAAALDEWRRSDAQSPVHVCFRLSSPEQEDDPWRVDLFLQSSTDPSLLVPARDVWRAGRVLALTGLVVAQPREQFLEGLGRASRVWPDVHAALDEPSPERVLLDAVGAHRFLSEFGPALREAGFGVMIPSFWERESSRLSVRLRVSTDRAASSGLLGVDAIAKFRYEAAIGGATLSPADLRELAGLKQPLVRLRGEWVVLDPGSIGRALAAIERPARDTSLGHALRVGLGLEPDEDVAVHDVVSDGWLGALLDGDERRLEAVDPPPALTGTLRPYQERGLGWLVFLDKLGLGACLADDMGLGKTIQLLALLLSEERTAPTLLVCPMSLVGNWQREAARFAPSLRVHVHHGYGRAEAFTSDADLVITTYGLATRDLDLLRAVAWGRVVLDEAQNVKNPSSRQARAVRSLPSERRVALTGTPVENRLGELWSIMEFLNPGLLGSAKSFKERFAIPVEKFRDDDAAARLRRVTSPFILRRLKTDRSIAPDLPDKIEMNVYCNLTREQATLYQAVVDDMLEQIESAHDDISRKGLVLATMTKLKQVCNHPAHFLRDGSALQGRSGKLARLEETLEEIVDGGETALVFTQYAQMGELLRERLLAAFGIPVGFFHGGLSKRRRDELVASFQSRHGPAVLVLSLKAGGVGLNLTAANHVVHFDRWWNPAVEDQATDRAFRIGQTKDVQVRKLVCAGTLEERIDELIASKRDLADRIVGTGESWLTELTTTQIRELVTLGADAVAED